MGRSHPYWRSALPILASSARSAVPWRSPYRPGDAAPLCQGCTFSPRAATGVAQGGSAVAGQVYGTTLLPQARDRLGGLEPVRMIFLPGSKGCQPGVWCSGLLVE